MNNIKLVIGNKEIPIIHTRFPGGESMIRLEIPPTLYEECIVNANVTLNFRDNGDLFDLMLLVDAIRREIYNPLRLSLTMPYLPYARQDRVCNSGESLSVRVVADLINSLTFDSVLVFDAHSDASMIALNNARNVPMHICAHRLATQLESKRDNIILVSPDVGAMKKVQAFAKYHKFPQVICAEKQRDTLTGEIKGITIPDSFDGLVDVPDDGVEFLVLDDICDGGRTFVELAKALNDTYKAPTDRLSLYVTHGIFSKGVSELYEYYDDIYTHNLMNEEIREEEVTIV
jgi:ribose-phosphate pyrophosphokinase